MVSRVKEGLRKPAFFFFPTIALFYREFKFKANAFFYPLEKSGKYLPIKIKTVVEKSLFTSF